MPCIRLGKVLEKIAKKFPELIIIKMNADRSYKAQTIMKEENQQSIPFLVLYEQGKQIITSSGYKEFAEIKSWLETYVNKS